MLEFEIAFEKSTSFEIYIFPSLRILAHNKKRAGGPSEYSLKRKQFSVNTLSNSTSKSALTRTHHWTWQ